jgi:hypothetical protein
MRCQLCLKETDNIILTAEAIQKVVPMGAHSEREVYTFCNLWCLLKWLCAKLDVAWRVMR